MEKLNQQRADKRPNLSDLRSSGSIEQDADMVLFLYRPSYYYNEADKDPDYRDMNPDDYQLLSELIISKHRNGDTGLMVQEKFKGNLSRFYSDDFSGKITPNDTVPF